jgi:hypothetical protein
VSAVAKQNAAKPEAVEEVDMGSILWISVPAENFSDKYLSSTLG